MKKLYMQQWLDANGRRRTTPDDGWYLDLSNRLLPLVEEQSVALKCALYLQDSVAQTGGWLAFKENYRRMYGEELPFYPVTVDYVPDEINPEDVYFLLWTSLSRPATRVGEDIQIGNPSDETLLHQGEAVYALLDECFEEAPIQSVASRRDWVMDMDVFDKPALPLPTSESATVTSRNAARCLAHSGGYPLLYFETYSHLKAFFVDVLQWENRPEQLLPELQAHQDFVIYANAKGMLIAVDAAFCFSDTRNPVYNPVRAAAEGYRLFCQPGACPFDLLKYGMAHHLLPDLALPFAGGKELFRQHWDFLARYFLGEYYEGD